MSDRGYWAAGRVVIRFACLVGHDVVKGTLEGLDGFLLLLGWCQRVHTGARPTSETQKLQQFLVIPPCFLLFL